jgi:hypothetical protein
MVLFTWIRKVSSGVSLSSEAGGVGSAFCAGVVGGVEDVAVAGFGVEDTPGLRGEAPEGVAFCDVAAEGGAGPKTGRFVGFEGCPSLFFVG